MKNLRQKICRSRKNSEIISSFICSNKKHIVHFANSIETASKNIIIKDYSCDKNDDEKLNIEQKKIAASA
jgi:hypothetical protein